MVNKEILTKANISLSLNPNSCRLSSLSEKIVDYVLGGKKTKTHLSKQQ